MATGSEISAVFCAAALTTLWPLVSQYMPRSRSRSVRQPVQRDVVEKFVLGEQALGLAVVVVVHPGRKARGRIRQGVADRLRPRAHHDGVGPVLLVERVERVERRALLLGESRRRGPAGGEHRGQSQAVRVAGKLMWMPSNPAGAWRAIALETGEPQSPPWAT